VKRYIIISAIAAIFAACAMGPNYRRPIVSAPDVFRGGTDISTTDARSIGDLKWFEFFKDDQLRQLIGIALEENYDLREAVARVSAERANLGITRADQFPTVTGTTNITNLRSSSSGSIPLPPAVNPDRTFGSVFLNLLSFEADVWGRLRRTTEAARANLLATEENRKAVVTTLVSDTATAYLSLLELDTELEIANRTLSTRQESLRLIQVREQGGIATELDVRQGEQLVYSASQTIPDIERQIEETENRLNLILGRSPRAITRGRSLMQQDELPSVPPGLPSSLLERRPDIRAAEQNLIASNAIIGAARAAYFPQISLTALTGFQSNQLSSLFTGATRNWQFVPQVTQPIFNAGRIRSNERLLEAQRQIALVQYDRVIQTAFREVSDALVDYRKLKEIRIQQELLVTTLRDRSRLAYLRYQGGVDTLLNALDGDRDLFNAELSLTQTRRNEVVSIVQLYKALGGGWQ
jgi:NodT family efflux transporter outer membrane factor (OMF) lipoprotein